MNVPHPRILPKPHLDSTPDFDFCWLNEFQVNPRNEFPTVLTAKPPWHLFSCRLYLLIMTLPQRESFSDWNLQHHVIRLYFSNKCYKCPDLQTTSHETRWVQTHQDHSRGILLFFFLWDLWFLLVCEIKTSSWECYLRESITHLMKKQIKQFQMSLKSHAWSRKLLHQSERVQ